MKEDKKNASRRYLKILGIVMLVMGALAMIGGIVTMFMKGVDIMSSLNAGQLRTAQMRGLNNNDLRIILGGIMIIGSLVILLEGWLLLRAAKDPVKSVLLLVLLVLSVVGSVGVLLSEGFKAPGTTITNMLGLTVYLLALIATLRVRSQIDE